MINLGVFLIFLISSDYLHLVSSKIGPLVKLSQQKGGDVRREETRTRIHGMIKPSYQKDFRLWKQREGPFYIVPYTIEGPYEEGNEETIIKEAMERIENNTCIRFKKWENEEHFLKIQNKRDGCVTYPRRSPMDLFLEVSERENCMSVKIALHELFHALGLEHEHQRPDRDEYVRLVENNIDPNETAQFNKFDQEEIATFGLPYDYKSIMHYDKGAAGNGTITMETIDLQFQDVIGNASDGTSMDYLKVCKIYGCETCHGKVDHYAYEKDMKRMKTPKLTFSLDGCKDNEGQEQCEQLLLGRQLNCAKDEDKARCGCTCSAYYENYDKMSFYLLPIRKHRAKYTQRPDCEDSDPWRCEVQLAYQKMDCNEDTETASCCVTCSLYRNYMRSD